jgi:signal transduction histidine kinase
VGFVAAFGLRLGLGDSRVRHSLAFRGAIPSAGSSRGKGLTITEAPLPTPEPAALDGGRRARATGAVRALPVVRYVAGVLVLAAAYFAAGRASLALQYDGPLAAILLPVGVGAAALYLAGLRWWPGVLIGDVALVDPAQPLGSALGIIAGNMADILVIAVVLRRLLGPRGALDRLEQVGGMLVAIAPGAAITATVAMLSLRVGGVVESSEVTTFWRSWFLADASGALVVIPLALAWAQPRPRPWRGRGAWEGALVIAAVVALSAIALSGDLPLTYMVFPALVWAALRLGQRGSTLAVAVAAGMAVGITANEVGAFVTHSITDSALSTQLYLAVSALSTLCLAAVVSEREAFAERLTASRARLVEAAAGERRRIEQNLHDGAQQRLTALAVRLHLAAEQARDAPEIAVGRLEAAEEEVSAAIEELRELAHGIHPSVLTVYGLAHALRGVAVRSAIPVRLVELPATRVDATAEVTAYFVVSEAITNARKHADATSIEVRAAASRGVLHVEVVDDGRGGATESAGSGLQGLRDRVEAIGGSFEVDSADGRGTRIVAVLPATPAPA